MRRNALALALTVSLATAIPLQAQTPAPPAPAPAPMTLEEAIPVIDAAFELCQGKCNGLFFFYCFV